MSLMRQHSLTVYPVTQARGADGRTADTLGTPIPVKASVQPLNAKERALLPEGKRTTAAVKLYTSTALAIGYRFTWGGVTYEIDGDGDYSEVGFTAKHRKYMASKVLES